MRSYVSNIGHPDPIRRNNFKLPIQCVVGDDSRLAAIASAAAFIADLCGNARDTGQARHTVLTASLASITQIIR